MCGTTRYEGSLRLCLVTILLSSWNVCGARHLLSLVSTSLQTTHWGYGESCEPVQIKPSSRYSSSYFCPFNLASLCFCLKYLNCLHELCVTASATAATADCVGKRTKWAGQATMTNLPLYLHQHTCASHSVSLPVFPSVPAYNSALNLCNKLTLVHSTLWWGCVHSQRQKLHFWPLTTLFCQHTQILQFVVSGVRQWNNWCQW